MACLPSSSLRYSSVVPPPRFDIFSVVLHALLLVRRIFAVVACTTFEPWLAFHMVFGKCCMRPLLTLRRSLQCIHIFSARSWHLFKHHMLISHLDMFFWLPADWHSFLVKLDRLAHPSVFASTTISLRRFNF
ncbi:hypothetical protein FB451DRAFT_1287563 [Mycena latifolia]|nr:hypothetical protein FB451DRAFT_1287563 [Mycena latifolia]